MPKRCLQVCKQRCWRTHRWQAIYQLEKATFPFKGRNNCLVARLKEALRTLGFFGIEQAQRVFGEQYALMGAVFVLHA
jgi:hypothetical protein